MISRAIGLAAAVALGFAFLPCLAAAQQPTDAQKVAIRSACPSDFQAHCAGVSPGGAAALQCLEKNVADLSSACQSAVKVVMPGAASAPAPATTDHDSDSSTSNTGNTATQPATKPATQSASQPEAAMPPIHLTLRQEIMLVRQSCGPDFRAHCSNVPLGGGNAVACLANHRAQLSPNCKEALAAVLLQ